MPALPITLPVLSAGFAAVAPGAFTEGGRVADAAAKAISSVLGTAVRIEARPLPGPATEWLGIDRVVVALEGVASSAVLEIDAGLIARTLERLSGRSARTPVALTSSAHEHALLSMLTLVAIDGAAGTPAAEALVPRVVADADDRPGEGLAIALELTVGEDRGRGRLVVPSAAIARLRGAEAFPSPQTSAIAVDASLRRGAVSLAPEELSALAVGDVVLLDDGPERSQLVLPGGLTLRGQIQESRFHVEEIRMTEAQAAYPLTLSVELARVPVTLGELARLAPGAVLPLDVRKDGAVVLRAGERAIARGKLVDIEGALGVLIAQLGDMP